MLSPLPRHSDWWSYIAHPFQSYQPSPVWLPGRPVHRLFRGLLGVHSRYGLHTRAATEFCGPLSEGFNHFVTSIVAPAASGWSISPGGAFTHWKAPPLHGARQEESLPVPQSSDPDRQVHIPYPTMNVAVTHGHLTALCQRCIELNPVRLQTSCSWKSEPSPFSRFSRSWLGFPT